MPVETFTLSLVDTGDAVLITLTGTLDVATCPMVACALGALDPDSASDVVADVAGVEFIDSTGLDLLTKLSLDLLAKGRRLIVASPSPMVTRLVSVTNLQSQLRLHDEVGTEAEGNARSPGPVAE